MSASEPLSPLVGRDRELEILRRQREAAIAGQGSVVLIGGEAGIGKTTLAEAICREAAEQDALVLVGRCYDLSETPPYGPWVELFGRYRQGEGMPPLPQAFARRGTVGAVASQGELFQQTLDFFTAHSETRPLVLLLDDLHWADPASLDLLRFLARSAATLALLLITTYRADELTRLHPLYALFPLLVREAHAARIDLQRLEEADVRTLVTTRYDLSDHDTERLVTYLDARSGGSPLFFGELLRTLEVERVMRHLPGGWTLGNVTQIRVPSLLRQVIDGRLVHLGEEAQGLLAVAAIIGQAVPFTLWMTIGDTDEETLGRVVERASDGRMLDVLPDGSGVRFAHALIREALYEGIAPLRRRSRHRQIGEQLAVLPDPDPDAVAYHFRQAGDPRAAPWLVRAGERAERAYAWTTAGGLFEAALTLLEGNGADVHTRGWLCVRLARLRRYTDPRQGIAYLDEAARLAAMIDDRVLLAHTLFTRGLLHCFVDRVRQGLGDMEAGVSAFEDPSFAKQEEIAAVPEGFALGRAHVPRATIVMWLAISGRFTDAQAMGARVIAHPPATAAERARGSDLEDAQAGLAETFAALGRPEEAHRMYTLAREGYRAFGHHLLDGGHAHDELLYVALPYRADQIAARRRLAAEAEAAWQRAGGLLADRPTRLIRLPLLAIEGQWSDVRQLEQMWEGSNHLNRVTAAAVAVAQGDRDAALATIRAMLPAGPRTEPGDTSLLNTLALQRLAAAIAIDAGDASTAREWLEAHDRWLAWSGAVLGAADGRLSWARFHRDTGARDRAHENAAQARALASEPRQPLALLAADRLLGELATDAGRFDEASAHLAQALALTDACAAPYERALTLLAVAELHAATGERDAAHALVDEVRILCAPLGAKPALALADALAIRLAEMENAPLAHPAGLSAREIEVLRLVAAGRSNREIADALFLAPGTVNIHVTHILAKTESANRTEAAAFAHRHGLA